jgi:N-acetyl-beta-hexosaminidase
MARYKGLMFIGGAAAAGGTTDDRVHVLTGVRIEVAAEARLELGVSEKYTVAVPDDGGPILVYAETQWGALRALETVSQLIMWEPDPAGDRYAVYDTPIEIEDWPRFAWRGE